jgi:DNA-binding IclR family transcriptional regulator
MRRGDGESVITRTFRLLSTFNGGRAEMTLEELAAAAGLSRTTTHRLAGQLVAEGALERSGHTWRLGTRMFELGQLVPREHQLRERALAHMQDLYVTTGETVQLAVADADTVLYVEIISGHRKVATPSRRGGRMPLHCTALGKVLVAFSSDAGRAWMDHVEALEPRTAHTITDIDDLRREVHRVRTEQVAFDHEEAAIGLRCVAAPILNHAGEASAALSVSMPTGGRLSVGEVTPAVRTVARALSREEALVGLR